WRQLLHSLQPPSSHSRAAAKARAATERPDPGGPVNSQAWVIAPGSGGRPAELGDHHVLAGQVVKDARVRGRGAAGHGRCLGAGWGVGVRTSALIAGKSPVLAS